ncbi:MULTISPECIES: bifunctional DNA-binding transcriptional regulator/O6-methylguanine-DNA methyltransferase Ada [Pseudomonas]|uniref:Bifunctional DNA-binding transcriptional regulator/O6-methylguanine-DNA methyltransferase Ada n=1 Tax=Pseudomonas taiwanensis TaxID=470150 RepID=A0ABR6V7I8_9PSED|nr:MULTISPECIES: bifunctional DNA-binding transcriptional regulator/O6-methylguanine-DNA methyltransferase Ada [Pseudomonas]AGZ37083.1 methylated-DNA--protein-cysteine methyltransferase [Pseudomonas sp. VLB120]MBC3476503.1 bifunctional DNA-binding transcriptional regulator/O6-methylguanine-DNA methyltransferase Ada [Pseudomonas taiwanensis]MBC3490754.1 bifunctional DNA-binding transcriptional regulator/O6-methylguanine-DNA methyltransferase Ada [Pseudomonas taiwanensis]MDT8922735.1 bifunctional
MSLYITDAQRWQAVQSRDSAAADDFVYAVRTTQVYCRPGCKSRMAKRENVVFFDDAAAAQAAGYRPCRRCGVDHDAAAARRTQLIARACRLIEAGDSAANLDQLAAQLAVSPFHLHRLFKAETGLTPKAYAAAFRARALREQLGDEQRSVTEAIYEAGYNSNSRFYETAGQRLGMLPKAYKAGGAGATIRFALGECSLGAILVAQSEKGICAILLGDDPEALLHELQDQFPKASLIGGDSEFERLVAEVVGFVEAPSIGLALPLDVQGTAFQERVWQALREVPAGSRVSYTDIAERIGAPKAMRAVAQACAANRIAVAIPCHRVVRRDGDVSGYRWGVERKVQLLTRETALS